MLYLQRALQLLSRYRRRFPAFLGVMSVLFLLGNVPAPYYACEGKQPGDPCSYGYGCGSGGACELLSAERCTDDPGTALNECLVCNTSLRPN